MYLKKKIILLISLTDLSGLVAINSTTLALNTSVVTKLLVSNTLLIVGEIKEISG